LEGRLAERWEHSADFRTWTIRLRDNIRWHDGRTVTAHDMKFTLDLLQHPDVLQFAAGSYTAEVLDPNTYTINYHRQDSRYEGGGLDDDLVCWPKHLLDKLDPKDINTWDFWSNPVGCGPYRHVHTVPHTMMEFEANPNYFRGQPRIERVVLKFAGSNPGSVTPELLSNNLDAAAATVGPAVVSAKRNRRLHVYQHLSTYRSKFDLQLPPVDRAKPVMLA
jgi:peptide/nickel transport system substrate-binding protein